MRKTLSTGLVLMLFQGVFGQMNMEGRLELQLKDGYKNEKIYKSTSGYFLLEAEAEKKPDKKQELRYDLYNADLKQVKSASLHLPLDMHYIDAYNDDTCVYKMYKNNKNAFVITRVKIDGLVADTVCGTMPKGIRLIDMKVLGEKAWFQAKMKRNTCMLQVDLKTGESKVSEFIEKKWSRKTSIVNYQLSPQSGELLVFMNKYIKKGACELSQMRVNGSCELCDTLQLTGTGDKVISTVSGCRMPDNNMVYTGTYSRKIMSQSEGLFFAKTENNKLSFINYVNFLDLDNFLSYRSDRSVERILKKKNRLEADGKEYGINYNIASHDILVIPGGYLLVGEAYYPTHNSIPHTTTTFINGVASTRTYHTTVFAGYQYTHAFVAAFSNEGELLWDQCFELNPWNKPHHVKRFIRISEQTDKNVALVYSSGKYMVSKVLGYDGKVEKELKTDLIGTGKETEKASWTISDADYWFGKYFLVYGTQKVKDNVDKSKRSVFFVNKVGY